MSDEVNYNFLTKSRWIATIPSRLIDPDSEGDIIFTLQDTFLPELGQASATITVGGYPIDVPAHVRELRKSMKFSYLLDSTMSQYKFLYKWYNQITNPSGMGTDIDSITDITIPIRVSLITEYKNEVASFLFENCWLKSVDGIQLDYTSNDAPVKHGFTVNYSHLTIE